MCFLPDRDCSGFFPAIIVGGIGIMIVSAETRL
jgi:hypothetical protein